MLQNIGVSLLNFMHSCIFRRAADDSTCAEKYCHNQDQAGHDVASTTSLYTGVSSDYRTRTLRRMLDQTVKDALSFGEESS